MAITIPQEYSYVLLAATSTLFVNAYHQLLTSSKRKASGIKYPTTYASQEVADKDPKAYQFNCGMCPPPTPYRSSR
jgi:glutathione S-transferase